MQTGFAGVAWLGSTFAILSYDTVIITINDNLYSAVFTRSNARALTVRRPESGAS